METLSNIEVLDPPTPRIFVALGSNLGNRLGHLGEALRRLEAFSTRVSPALLVETPALLATADAWPQPPYLNTVVEVRSPLEPEPLLRRLLEVELAMGRERTGQRWAPRTIDLDLLLYGQREVRSGILTLPHPGLTRRAFVLVPLAAIAADLPIPGDGRTVANALRDLSR